MGVNTHAVIITVGGSLSQRARGVKYISTMAWHRSRKFFRDYLRETAVPTATKIGLSNLSPVRAPHYVS